jgi:hypothetical protein
MSNDVHPIFAPLVEFMSGKTKQSTDWCPHGKPSHEQCDDCEESDAEELML